MDNKILIIDDNITFCNAVKYHLIKKELDVEICISYTEFQNKINFKEFDIILLDIKLKDAEGLDILRYILETDPNKKIIIVSSYLDYNNILKAKELGAFKCIHKNINLFKELDHILEEI